MMSFKEWMRTEYGGHTFAFFRTDDKVGRANAEYLIEGGRTWDLGKGWSVRMDPPHAPNMEKHNHVMFKEHEVSIINRSGSQSHGTRRDNVPNWVVEKIKGRGWITESTLVEASGQETRIPPELIDQVYFRARVHDLLFPLTRRFR